MSLSENSSQKGIKRLRSSSNRSNSKNRSNSNNNSNSKSKNRNSQRHKQKKTRKIKIPKFIDFNPNEIKTSNDVQVTIHKINGIESTRHKNQYHPSAFLYFVGDSEANDKLAIHKPVAPIIRVGGTSGINYIFHPNVEKLLADKYDIDKVEEFFKIHIKPKQTMIIDINQYTKADIPKIIEKDGKVENVKNENFNIARKTHINLVKAIPYLAEIKNIENEIVVNNGTYLYGVKMSSNGNNGNNGHNKSHIIPFVASGSLVNMEELTDLLTQ